MSKPAPFEVKPASGGALLCDLSAENVGLANYITKSEWRRYLDREIRSEGYDKFNPAAAAVPPETGYDDPVTLVCECLSQSGRRALVIGSRSNLWRYYGSESGAYFGEDYDSEDYDLESVGEWALIGSGFSSNGKRWEAESIAGLLILNNGVDLPVSYNLNDMAVKPIYELREQGIASVGTIWKYSDILMCGDINQINADKHQEIMTPVAAAVDARVGGVSFVTADGETVLCTVSDGGGGEGNTLECDLAPTSTPLADWLIGATVRLACGLERTVIAVPDDKHLTLDGDPVLIDVEQPFVFADVGLPNEFKRLLPAPEELFPGVDPYTLIGKRLFWESGDTRQIVAYEESSGYLIVDSDSPVAEGPVGVENSDAYSAFTDPTYLDRYRWRALWSMPGKPRRFAAVVPATAVNGSYVLRLDYPVQSLESGQEITVTDAGPEGETLRTTILFAYPGLARSITMIDRAENDTNECLVSATDAVGSIVGYYDLTGDGSGILRGTTLKGYVVVAKESGFFLGRYTGSSAEPFAFEEVVCREEASLRHRNIFINVGDDFILYPGEASFYKFDLTTRQPMEFGPLGGCQQCLFFDSISKQELESPLEYESEDVTNGNQTRTSVTWSDLKPGAAYDLFTDGKVTRIYAPKLASVVDGEIVYDTTSHYTLLVKVVISGNTTYEITDFWLKAADDSEDRMWAVENAVTKEVWIGFPSRTSQNIIRLDLDSLTVSTSGLDIASARTISKPENSAEVGRNTKWFVMGGSLGEVFRYGFTNEPTKNSGGITATFASGQVVASDDFFAPSMVGKSILFNNKKCVAITAYVDQKTVTVIGTAANTTNQKFRVIPAIWHRDGEGYDSVLESGLDALGKPESEKVWNQYAPILASQQSVNAELGVTVRMAHNPDEVTEESTSIAKPLTENLVTLSFVSHYLGDKITVSGAHNPCELTSRTFAVSVIGSNSFQRRVK